MWDFGNSALQNISEGPLTGSVLDTFVCVNNVIKDLKNNYGVYLMFFLLS